MSYDANGNICTLHRYYAPASDTSYIYGYTGNQLTTLLKSGNSYLFVYDANGNMIKSGLKGLNLSYNYLNLPYRISRTDGTMVAEYRYLSNGRKLKVTGSGGDGYVYIGSMIYVLKNGKLSLESTDFAGGRILQTSSGLQVRYHVTDHLGSPRVVLDESMTVIEQNDYYPFRLRHENPTMTVSGNRFRFNGKEKQRIGGLNLIDLGWRMYDALWGRHYFRIKKEFKICLISYC